MFFIEEFFSKCDQIHRKLQETRIWSQLLKKSFTESFHFVCSVSQSAISDFFNTCRLKHLVNLRTCFKKQKNATCIDFLLTSCPTSFQDTRALESGLSDFHKMNLKTKNQMLVHTEDLKHLAASNSKSSKHDVSNEDYEKFHKIMFSQ